MIFCSNHPVHIFDENGHMNPSAFIPFCQFGVNMSVMGVKSDEFDVPVCDVFKAKAVNDQLCYEVDPNGFKDPSHIDRDLKRGLTLLIDYNEDRQVVFDNPTSIREDDIYGQFIQSKNEEEVIIHMDTIGNTPNLSFEQNVNHKYNFPSRTTHSLW